MESSDLHLLVPLDALLQEASVSAAARRVGLSTPAMSHALGRIRERLHDPILVRAGRRMVLTPRAEALRPRVRSLVAEATQALAPDRPFTPAELTRTFYVHATDYVPAVLGVAFDRIVRAEAPGATIRFVPSGVDDPGALRDGTAHLALCVPHDLPAEMRIRRLLSDRFVCVVRADHPEVGKRLTLQQFVRLTHVQVAPRGLPGGYLDDALRARGLERRVARALPFFMPAFHLVAATDYVLTVAERLVQVMARGLELRVLAPPLELHPYMLNLVWHPRFDGDAAHRWLRDVFVRAAAESLGETEARPRPLRRARP